MDERNLMGCSGRYLTAARWESRFKYSLEGMSKRLIFLNRVVTPENQWGV